MAKIAGMDRRRWVISAAAAMCGWPALASAANITSIPTLMAFKEGVLVFAQPGALPQSALQNVIDQVKALDMAPIKEQLAAQGSGSAAEA